MVFGLCVTIDGPTSPELRLQTEASKTDPLDPPGDRVRACSAERQAIINGELPSLFRALTLAPSRREQEVVVEKELLRGGTKKRMKKKTFNPLFNLGPRYIYCIYILIYIIYC